MTRRGLLLGMLTVGLRADDAQDVWDVFTELASALSEGNPVQFLKAFDRSMTGYRMLEADVTALLGQAEVQSSIEILSDEGNGATGRRRKHAAQRTGALPAGEAGEEVAGHGPGAAGVFCAAQAGAVVLADRFRLW
jgi:hypothetical protein